MQPPQSRHARVCAALLLCAFTLFAPGVSSAQSTPISSLLQTQATLHEVRGLWVVRTSIESPDQIHHLVQAAKANGFNTLFVQVRGRGDAYYLSSIEPRAQELSGQPATFDPLQTVIDDAHASGIQVHAWVNACYVWSSGTPPDSAQHIVNQHPDWMARDAQGRFTFGADAHSDGAFISPSNTRARQELHDVCMEITQKYDIDGLHFDYIRYPNSDYDYSTGAVSAFANTLRPVIDPALRSKLDGYGDDSYTHYFSSAWASWRRDQVTSLVEWISNDVKTAKPWVCMSAAVYADWQDAYTDRGQDWHKWLKDGALDAVIPMAYSANTLVVEHQIADAELVAKASGRVCFAGLGSWRISSASTINKIAAARQVGAQGVVLFSYGGMTQDGATDSYLAQVDQSAFQVPASVPVIKSVGTRPDGHQVGVITTPVHNSTQAAGG